MSNSSIFAIGGGAAAVAIAIVVAVTMFSGESENPEPLNNVIEETTQEIVEVQDTKIKAYASFYPYYEFTRNVAGDAAIVEQFMPSGIEAHDWEPRPKDIQSLQDASVFVYNGIGMEPYIDNLMDSGEFDNVVFVKASEGIEPITPEGHAFEWAGVFDVAAGTYTWSFAKVDGDYADPAMKMIILESDDIESSEELAESLLESDNVESKNDGNTLVAKETAYLLNFDDSKDMTIFSVDIAKDGKYAFFTEHMPFEFEADEHFFKDASRDDVEPIMEEPESGHGDHGEEGHAFEWAGVFDVAAGTYTWSFAKVDGDYADPAMKMIILESDDIESSEELAESLLESDNVESKNDGNTLVAKETAYLLNFDDSKDMTIFSVDIAKDGKYAFFTEHMPFEFEADEHFFKDASRDDVEPIMEEPESGHGHHHHASEFDPHIWLDPVLVKQQVNNIRDGLIEADPQNKEQYEANAIAYNEKLDELDMNIKSSLSSCNKNSIVPFHNAFAYLAERHDFEVMSITGLSPHSEASAAKIAEFVDFVEENDLKVIFSEEAVDPRLAEVIAEEAGVEVMILSPLETLSQDEIGTNITYLDKMERNVDVLKIALECQ